jgi:hypothetical protein
MFATRRSRPRRATRFVPGVDLLQSRIAPVGDVAPLDPPHEDPPPAETVTIDQEVLDELATFDEVCRTTALEI